MQWSPSPPLEVVTILQYEPFLQQCFRTMEGVLFAHELQCEIKFQKVNEAFSTHIQKYYVEFARNALRLIYFCGFVPWRVRTLPSGDKVPETLPIGSFQWNIRVTDRVEAKEKPLLQYEITNCTCSIDIKEIKIFQAFPPVFTRSFHQCTSPLTFAVRIYKDYLASRNRVVAVHDWNAMPHLVVESAQKVRINSAPEARVIGSNYARGVGGDGFSGGDRAPLGHAFRNVDILAMMRNNGVDTSSCNLFVLPDDCSMELLGPLSTQEDPESLLLQYHKSICDILGVPAGLLMHQMVYPMNTMSIRGCLVTR